nr:antiviral reverse transcriptase Drt2 [Fundidesulfovibrio soli]
MYPSHGDSAVYSYYAHQLNRYYEIILEKDRLNPHILAFRKTGKNNIDYAHMAFIDISNRHNCTALAFDISKFFDNINHEVLKNKWKEIINTNRLPIDHYKVFRSLTKFAHVELNRALEELQAAPKCKCKKRLCSSQDFRNLIRSKGLIETNTKTHGIPQGSPLSGLLSNISLLDFDRSISDAVHLKNASYYRYCDDILVICANEDACFFKHLVETQLKNVQLSTNNKTNVHKFSKHHDIQCTNIPLQYLGFMFDGKAIYIRSSSIQRFRTRSKKRIYAAIISRNTHNNIRSNRGEPHRELYTRKLYARNTHHGSRNFITYGLRALKTTGSKTIKNQLKKLGRFFEKRLADAKEKYSS